MLPQGIVGSVRGRFVSFNRFYVDGPAYGGLPGSVEDAARFLALHTSGGAPGDATILSTAAVASMQKITARGRKLDVGLGWFRRRADREIGPPYLEHLGGGGGFFNMMRLFPELEAGVIVMGNATSYGGGGYVLACAFKVPERLTAAVILSGMGPTSRPEARQGMAAINRVMYGLSASAPWVIRALSWATFRAMARSLRRPAREGEPPGPLDLFGDPAARPALLADLDEAVLKPGTRGLVAELALYSRPWGFALEDINFDIHLWHGEDDRNVPASLARYVAGALPRSHTTFVKGGHTAPFKHISEAISVLREPVQ